MSSEEDKDSKTEDASEKKINDALEKGKVPFSKEVTNLASLTAVLVVAFFYLPDFANDLILLLRSMFANLSEWPLDGGGDVSKIGYIIVTKLMLGMAPLILPLLLFGLVASFSQNQPRMVLDRISPKLERISLAKGAKRLFGFHSVKEFTKSLFKFSAAAIIGTIICVTQVDWVLSHVMIDAVQIPATIYRLSLQVIMGLVSTMTVLAFIDFIWTRREWYNDLKMSHQELKDERKQSEGDPMVKMRSRSIAQDRARRRMINSVDEATLVIANPTHFAVALRYDPAQDRAPIVLAKGQDLIALKIRERAEENDVPVIEDKPLARSLYKVAQVDQEIPVEFYVPVAKLVRILSEKEQRMH